MTGRPAPTLLGEIMGRFSRFEDDVYAALAKFHRETQCGRFPGQEGQHWAECKRATRAFGYDSWDAWMEMREMSRL